MSSAVTVRVPTILRTYTGGSSTVTADGSTVGEVIDNLESVHPGIRARVIDETGALRRFVNIYLDDEDIRFGDGPWQLRSPQVQRCRSSRPSPAAEPGPARELRPSGRISIPNKVCSARR